MPEEPPTRGGWLDNPRCCWGRWVGKEKRNAHERFSLIDCVLLASFIAHLPDFSEPKQMSVVLKTGNCANFRPIRDFGNGTFERCDALPLFSLLGALPGLWDALFAFPCTRNVQCSQNNISSSATVEGFDPLDWAARSRVWIFVCDAGVIVLAQRLNARRAPHPGGVARQPPVLLG